MGAPPAAGRLLVVLLALLLCALQPGSCALPGMIKTSYVDVSSRLMRCPWCPSPAHWRLDGGGMHHAATPFKILNLKDMLSSLRLVLQRWALSPLRACRKHNWATYSRSCSTLMRGQTRLSSRKRRRLAARPCSS